VDKEYRLLGVRLDGAGPFFRETVTGDQTSASSLNRVEDGDFIYSRLFAWRGAFGVVSPDLTDCYVSSEFPVFQTNNDAIDLRFLTYWFRLPSTLRRVAQDCSGSTALTRNRFKEDFFLNLEIPLPPLAEQRRLVAKLDAVAAAIDRITAAQAANERDSESLEVALHETAAAGRIIPIHQLLELHEEAQSIDFDSEYPQVGVKSFGCGLFAKGAIAGSQTTYRTFNRLFAGALVLSQVKGWEGAIAVCPAELAGWFVSPEYRTFRCRDGEADPAYLATIVRKEWFWSRLRDATHGAGARRERVRPERFLNLELPMPDIARQRRLLPAFRAIAQIRSAQSARAADLAALMPSILDRAFNDGL